MNTEGYMHCTTMNFILRTMCLRSNYFHEDDIELKWTQTWFLSPHQYMRIRLTEDTYVEVDPWNYQFGIEYGKHGSRFDSVHIFPIR